MIVTITAHYVKRHSPVHLLCLRVRQTKHSHRLKYLLIAVLKYIVEIEMAKCTECLNMNFISLLCSVKAFGHEVSSVIFFKQTGFHHFNSGIFSHFIISHFNTTITVGCSKLFIHYSVKLDQPMLESLRSKILSTSYFFCNLIESNYRFSSGSTGRCSNFKNIIKCTLFFTLPC